MTEEKEAKETLWLNKANGEIYIGKPWYQLEDRYYWESTYGFSRHYSHIEIPVTGRPIELKYVGTCMETEYGETFGVHLDPYRESERKSETLEFLGEL